ncbi:MAG: Uma2 family endonuclease [Microcystaceae cyanobacterium]
MPTLVESPPKLYSPTEYLALEEKSEQRNEYLDGVIVPMTGGSLTHNQIIINLCTLLRIALRPNKGKVFTSDLRVWIPETHRYTYPDVLVIRDEPQFYENRTDTILNPTLIIEVLSPSTSDYDRGDKFKSYRSIPSFQEYWLVEQSQLQVEQYCKTDDETWLYRAYDNSQATLRSPILNVETIIQDIYEDVDF